MRYVLDGEIIITGPDVTVLARLQDVEIGATVWSDRMRVRADQLFSVEDVITERVVAALRLRLAAAEQDRLRRRYTSNSAAYGEYLRGRAALVKYTPEGTQSAIEAFGRALQRDPGYALARAGLAMACADMYLRFARSGEVERWGERAEAEARAALALDSDLAEAHLASAAVARKREFDWHATITAGRRALVLNPNLDQARFFVAAAYYHNGYMEETLIEMEKGRSLHGVDAIEPIRIEALVALFSGKFAAGSRPPRRSQPFEQSGNRRHVPCAGVLLLRQHRARTDDARIAGEPLIGFDVGACRRGARRRPCRPGRACRRPSADRSCADAGLSRSSRRLQPRDRVCAAWGYRRRRSMASHRRRYRVPVRPMVRT